jgi:hypothetical protein
VGNGFRPWGDRLAGRRKAILQKSLFIGVAACAVTAAGCGNQPNAPAASALAPAAIPLSTLGCGGIL